VVTEAIKELISFEELGKEIADEFVNEFELDEARRHIEERFAKDRSLSWRKAFEESLEEARERHSGDFRSAVENKLRERFAPETGEAS
jgi:hypothetical protein